MPVPAVGRVRSSNYLADRDVAHRLSCDKSRPFMNKGERISHFVSGLAGESASVAADVPIAQHPYYRAFFKCWNEQHYYEAHDVLEQVWLKKKSADDHFFKGLIQAAGAFVHLQ